MGATIRRQCRACGITRHVAPGAERCPECGVAYGRLTFGMDVDPDEAKRFGQAKPEPDSPEVQRLIARYGLNRKQPPSDPKE